MLALAGALLAAQAADTGHAFLVVLGIGVGEIGLVLGVGAMVTLAARAGRRLPPAVRLALRDATRHRSRTTPAVAAVTAALAGATAALLYLAAQDEAERQVYRPLTAPGTLWVSADNGEPLTGDLSELRSVVASRIPVRGEFVTVSGPLRPDGTAVEIQAVRAAHQVCPRPPDPPLLAGTAAAPDPRCDPELGRGPDGGDHAPYVDDGSATELLTGVRDASTAAALAAGKVVVRNPTLLWPDGTVHLTMSWDRAARDAGGAGDAGEATGPDPQQPARMRSPEIAVPAVVSTAPRTAGWLVIPPSRAAQLGLVARPVALLARPAAPPTDRQELLVDTALHDRSGQQLGLHVERGPRSPGSVVLISTVAAALLVALIGTFTAIGLTAAESRADLATLAAVGAAPALRRRLAAVQAGIIAVPGTLLGLVGGSVAGVALLRLLRPDQSFLETLAVPWTRLAALGLGVPLLAVLAGFLSARSRLPVQRRTGL